MRPRNFPQERSIHCHHRRQPYIPNSQRASSSAKRACGCASASHSQASRSKQRPTSKNSQKNQEIQTKSRIGSRCQGAPPKQVQPTPIKTRAKSVARLHEIAQEQSKRIVELIREKGDLLCQNRRMEAMLGNPAMRREQEYHQEHIKREELLELKREIVNIKNNYEQRIEELTKDCGYPEVTHLELNTPEKSQSFKTKNTQRLDESYGVSMLHSRISGQNPAEESGARPFSPNSELPPLKPPQNQLHPVPNTYFTKASRLFGSVERPQRLYCSSKEIRFVSPSNYPSNLMNRPTDSNLRNRLTDSNLMNRPTDFPSISRPPIQPFGSATQPNIKSEALIGDNRSDYSSSRMVNSKTILPLKIYGGYQPGGNVFRVSSNGTLEPYVREPVDRNQLMNK